MAWCAAMASGSRCLTIAYICAQSVHWWALHSIHTGAYPVQVVLPEDAGQLCKLAVSGDMAAVSDPEPLGLCDAPFHWTLRQRLHRAVCTVASKL